jgi:hypothetical protein
VSEWRRTLESTSLEQQSLRRISIVTVSFERRGRLHHKIHLPECMVQSFALRSGISFMIISRLSY